MVGLNLSLHQRVIVIAGMPFPQFFVDFFKSPKGKYQLVPCSLIHSCETMGASVWNYPRLELVGLYDGVRRYLIDGSAIMAYNL